MTMKKTLEVITALLIIGLASFFFTATIVGFVELIGLLFSMWMDYNHEALFGPPSILVVFLVIFIIMAGYHFSTMVNSRLKRLM